MVGALLLDVNETLFPLTPVADRLAAAGLAEGTVDLWFARVLRDGFAASVLGSTVPFPTLARHHLGALLGRPVDSAAVDEVMAGFDEVGCHPDVEPALERLAAAKVPVVAVTNGTASLVEAVLERDGLRHLVADVLEAARHGGWKPRPAPYIAAAVAAGVTPADAAFVAVHPWDVHGAIAAGCRGVWLDRSRSAAFPSWWACDVRVASLVDAVDVLLPT